MVSQDTSSLGQVICFLNSLVPGTCGSNNKSVISERMPRIGFMNTSFDMVFRWMPQNTADDDLTLVQWNYLSIPKLQRCNRWRLGMENKITPCKLCNHVFMLGYRIWSWSPMSYEKHGPRDSVDKNRSQKPNYWGSRAIFFASLGSPWSNPIIARSLIEFCHRFIHRNMDFNALK